MKNFILLFLNVTTSFTRVLVQKGTPKVSEFTEQKIWDMELLLPNQLAMGTTMNSQNITYENSI